MKKCVGVDLGGTTVKMGILGEDGTIFEKWEIPTRKEDNGKYILGDIAASAKELLAAAGIADEDFVGVGIGVPGPVRSNGYVEVCVNLGWKDINPAAELSSLLGGVPVKAGNDANVAALGEQWMGSGKGHDSLMFFTLGTGVGGGLIIDGKIVAGSKGMGAEVGHLTVNPHEKDCCNCGNHGCLEQYASATGITRLANRRLAKDDAPSILRGGEISAKTVFDAVKAGDKVAIEIAEQFGEYLGKGLAAVASVVDPQIFVIGGGVSKAGDILFKYIEPSYKRCAFGPCKQAKFALAKLGNDAGIYGAAALVLK